MKRIIITLALSLLPIVSIQPAEAGVYTCNLKQVKLYTKSGIQYKYKNVCRYSSKGSSK